MSNAAAKVGHLEAEVRRLKLALLEACDLAEEANGDSSSCSYSVPIGERVTELRAKARP